MRSFLLLTVFAAGSLMADPVLTFDTSTSLGVNFNTLTIGWQFNVLSPTLVDGLGWFDQGLDGLQQQHEVGIWNSAGTLLASAIIQAGTTDPLDGVFRTVAITPLVLSPGAYTVGGLYFARGDQADYGVVPTTKPNVSFVGGVYSGIDATFERPTVSTLVANCCWGPSFSDSVATPEPVGASVLLAFGILAAALRARRQHRA